MSEKWLSRPEKWGNQVTKEKARSRSAPTATAWNGVPASKTLEGSTPSKPLRKQPNRAGRNERINSPQRLHQRRVHLQASIWCSLQKKCLVKNKKWRQRELTESKLPPLPFRRFQGNGLTSVRLGTAELYHEMLTRPRGEAGCWRALAIQRLCLSTATLHSTRLHTVFCVSFFSMTNSCMCHEGQAMLQWNTPDLMSFSLKPSPALSWTPLQAVGLHSTVQHRWLHLRCVTPPTRASEMGGKGTQGTHTISALSH